MGPRLVRWFCFGAMAASVTILLIGKAADAESRTQERVITTRHGRTIDCRVDRYEDGSIYLNDCKLVVQFP